MATIPKHDLYFLFWRSKAEVQIRVSMVKLQLSAVQRHLCRVKFPTLHPSRRANPTPTTTVPEIARQMELEDRSEHTARNSRLELARPTVPHRPGGGSRPAS